MYELLFPMLASWKTINTGLSNLNEDQVKALLDHELNTAKRKDIIERLHGRFNRLRMQRERAEMFRGQA